MIAGAVHVHTTYSDGELSLRQVRDVFRAAGCRFVCVSDHADAFAEGPLRRYVAECAALSGDDFVLVPGLEFGCARRLHVLGLGVTTLTDHLDPVGVFAHIADAGGLSAIAHPPTRLFAWIEQCAHLPDAIEVWNSKYDGQYAPRPETFTLVRRLQERRPDLRALYGQDLHWRWQYRGLLTVIPDGPLSAARVLASLRDGAYLGTKDSLALPPDGDVPDALLARFATAHRRASRVRRWMTGAKRLADRAGIEVPAPVKAQLRRIL